MRIAVVGSGVSGLVAAWLLARRHEVVLYEAADRLGGHAHTNTVDFGDGAGALPVDTGFIVYNHRTYPLFCRVLDELGIRGQQSDMSFSASIPGRGVEYNGTDLNGLFAQRRNLLRPSFWSMVRGILRFYREARELLEPGAEEVSLGDYLRRKGYRRSFIDDHLVPMAAAVWSTDRARMMDFPARFLVRFFEHHGFMEVDDRPAWYTVPGGSRTYVEAIARDFGGRLRLGEAVREVRRGPDGARVVSAGAAGLRREDFDQLVLACHSDTALALLGDASADERAILGALPYQRNVAVLHTDASVMPRTRRAWASWNYHVGADADTPPTVTYWMNRLQGIRSPKPLFVTLNREDEIDPAQVHGRWIYHHPLFTAASVAAQARQPEIQGARSTWYAGAYWGYGFHEDGARSGVAVARALGVPFAEDLPPRPIDLHDEATPLRAAMPRRQHDEEAAA